MTGPRRRSFHGEIIRTLLYMEHYELVTALIADFCVLSVAVQVGKRWCELVNQLNGEEASEDELVKRNKKHRRNKSTEEGEKLSKEMIAFHGEDNNTELIEEVRFKLKLARTYIPLIVLLMITELLYCIRKLHVM